MDTPDRDDEPVASWEYRDHQCRVYVSSSETPDAGAGAVWAGYTRSKLPDGADEPGPELHVPGSLVDGGEGWIGFSVSGDDRDEERTRADVEELVDQLVGLESSMDG